MQLPRKTCQKYETCIVEHVDSLALHAYQAFVLP